MSRVLAFTRGRPSNPDVAPMTKLVNDRVKALAKACKAEVYHRRDNVTGSWVKVKYIIHAAMKPHRSQAVRTAQRLGIPILVIEHGYYGDRLQSVSLGWNGINGRAIRPPPGNAPRPFPVLKRWVDHRPETGRILIPLQVPKDESLEGTDIRLWIKQKVKELRLKYPDAQIEVRHHPETLWETTEFPEDGAFWADSTKPILDVIRDYALVATYSSNVGVDAIRFGVPATADSR